MSMYTTAQLLAANEKKFKFDPLFLRLFFRESYPFTTEKVYLSQIPGLVNMALYVSPIVSGEVIRSRGGSTSEFTPGYVKPKHEVNPQMTLRRLPDEDPQNLADPAYRRRRIILQNMRDEELAIAQVEEMQAVSAVLKGKYTMTGEAFDPVEVDNRVASSAISQSASQVARETKVRRKLVKERARLKRATVKNPQARIKVNRGDLPVIKLGNARIVLSRRRRRKKGQRSALKGGGSVLVVGNRRIPGAFIQQLKNGRWHVMQRVAGKNRYPIDVVKIPMAVPLTTAFKQNIERIRRERLPKELGYALQHQLRMVIKR